MCDKGNARECSQCWPEVMGSYFPISKPCETIRDCPSLRSRGCWQWSPSGRAGVVEKRYWQALPCTHVLRLGVYLNTAAAAPRFWSCLCLAIRILGLFFNALVPQDLSQFCLLHNVYLCFTKALRFCKYFARLQRLCGSVSITSQKLTQRSHLKLRFRIAL